MLEISELIYETCKTYLLTQGKFLMILELFIGAAIIFYFGFLRALGSPIRSSSFSLFSLIGIAGSYSVAWFGIRVNTFANSRTAFASLRGKPYPCYDIPLQAGMSIGMLLISVELLIMLCILLFVPGDLAGPCFIGFAIGESLGAAALRVAGGIFTKIADIGADLMKIVFKIKEDDARNPASSPIAPAITRATRWDPRADGFETYGVTGVALITFILLAVHDPTGPGAAAGLDLRHARHDGHRIGVGYFINDAIAKAKYGNADKMNFEAPLTTLVWLTSIVSVVLTYVVSLPDDSRSRRRHLALVEALDRHHLRHAGRRDHPRIRQGVHLHRIAPRARGRHGFARRRRVAEHPVRFRGRQLQRVLARAWRSSP